VCVCVLVCACVRILSPEVHNNEEVGWEEMTEVRLCVRACACGHVFAHVRASVCGCECVFLRAYVCVCVRV
jgi:hypothetical protein